MKHIVNRTLQTTTTFIHLPAEYNVLAPTKEAVPADLVSRSLQARMVTYKYQTGLNWLSLYAVLDYIVIHTIP